MRWPRWWSMRRKKMYLATLFELEQKVAELELRPPVMDIKFTVDGEAVLNLTTRELYLAMKWSGYGAGVTSEEWYGLLGNVFSGQLFLDKGAYIDNLYVQLSVKESNKDG